MYNHFYTEKYIKLLIISCFEMHKLFKLSLYQLYGYGLYLTSFIHFLRIRQMIIILYVILNYTTRTAIVIIIIIYK